jgi:hypothetical protein
MNLVTGVQKFKLCSKSDTRKMWTKHVITNDSQEIPHTCHIRLPTLPWKCTRVLLNRKLCVAEHRQEKKNELVWAVKAVFDKTNISRLNSPSFPNARTFVSLKIISINCWNLLKSTKCFFWKIVTSCSVPNFKCSYILKLECLSSWGIELWKRYESAPPFIETETQRAHKNT